MTISIPHVDVPSFGDVRHSFATHGLQLALKAAAHVPGDPLTKALARQVPDFSVKRTSDSSWRMIDRQGRSFTAQVSGTDVVVRGQDGTHTRVPISFPGVSLPSLPSMPKLPQLPGVDVGKLVGGVVVSASMAALRQPAMGTLVIGSAAHQRYPGAKVKYDGSSTWTVSNLGMEAPFQVRVHGNTISAERNGRAFESKTIAAGDVTGALRSLFVRT